MSLKHVEAEIREFPAAETIKRHMIRSVFLLFLTNVCLQLISLQIHKELFMLHKQAPPSVSYTAVIEGRSVSRENLTV